MSMFQRLVEKKAFPWCWAFHGLKPGDCLNATVSFLQWGCTLTCHTCGQKGSRSSSDHGPQCHLGQRHILSGCHAPYGTNQNPNGAKVGKTAQGIGGYDFWTDLSVETQNVILPLLLLLLFTTTTTTTTTTKLFLPKRHPNIEALPAALYNGVHDKLNE